MTSSQTRRSIIGASDASQKTLVIATNHPNFFLSHRLELAKRAQRAGYRVVGMFPNTPEVKKVLAQGFEVKTFTMNRSGLNPFIELQSIVSFYLAMKSVAPDIYHGFTIKPLIYGIIIARIIKVPTILGSVTGLGYSFLAPGLKGWLIRKLVGLLYLTTLKADSVKIIFQNADDQTLFIDSQWIKRHQAQIILGTGVDTEKFYPPADTRAREKIVVLYPGRLLIHKGLRELFQACQNLSDRKLNFELQICGSLDPENLAALPEAEFNHWKEKEFLNYRGQISNMNEIYRTAHIVCLPSYREGLALALLEAASSGCALLTTNAPGCRDVVQDQKTGLLIPIQDSLAIEKSLEKLITNHDLRESLGRAAHIRAIKDFSQDKILAEFLSLYSATPHASTTPPKLKNVA